MPTIITTHAIEEGTFALTAAFVDENGDAVIPNSGLTWTLTDTSGEVINSRTAESISPASSVTIVLSGDDLALPVNVETVRVLTVQGTYNGTLGSNLPIKNSARFIIEPLVAVS